MNGEYYDVCAVARKDAPGIIIGYYKQPSGLISDTENDLESLLTGLDLEQNGHYAIIKGSIVRATSAQSMKDKKVSDDAVLQQLSHIEQNGRLHLIKADGKHYWGYRSAYEGYIICIYYPFITVFSDSLSTSALFAAVYFFFCVLYFALRNRTLYENQEKLKESNSRLTETVRMLLIIQLNLAILDEFIDNKSPFYDYLLNIDHFLWQGSIGGAIVLIFTVKTMIICLKCDKKLKFSCGIDTEHR